jgi:hypothetical protein
MPQVDLFGDSNVPRGTEVYDKRIAKIQAEIHNYLRQGLVPGAVQQVIDKLDNISIDADTVNLNTDQLEAKLDTLNALMTSLVTGTANGITAISPRGLITNRSGTIGAAGVSQVVAPENLSRKYFAIQNISDQELFLGIGYAPTVLTGILVGKLGGGFVFESNFIPTQAINIVCLNFSGKPFIAWEG